MIAVFNNFRKILLYLVIFTILFGTNSYMAFSTKEPASSSPMNKLSVVLDAGHGGIDSGCVGVNTGVFESDINLSICKKIGKNLNNIGIKTVYTRTNTDGLYGTFVSGHKKRDMQAREKIIKQAKPNLVVSIHLNSYTSSTPRGAQVFYAIDSPSSQELASNIQELFAKEIVGSKKSCAPGDFYILNCSPTCGILIECGFLSNPEEEKLLSSNEYQEKLAFLICSGIISFFELT